MRLFCSPSEWQSRGMILDPRPLPLEGRHVRLEPLEEGHQSLLRAAVLGEAEVFRWTLDDCLARPAESDGWFDGALQAVRNGTAVVWATIRRSDGRFVGSTRFMGIRRPHRSLEIGNT